MPRHRDVFPEEAPSLRAEPGLLDRVDSTKVFALLMIGGVAFLTLIANFGVGNRVFSFLNYVPGGDTTGHFALYGLLSFAVISCVSRPTRAATRSARIRTTAVLAVLITLEESSQAFIPARTFSLVDLAASLAGLAAGSLPPVRS